MADQRSETSEKATEQASDAEDSAVLRGMTPEQQFKFVLRVLSIFNGFGNGSPSSDQLWWRTDAEYAPVTLLVNCNDTFWWGCSDCEQVTPANVELLERAVADVRAVGGGGTESTELFCARVRGMRPQGACYRHYDKATWPLFDACGPEREVGFGNPYAPGGNVEAPAND